MAKEFKSSVSLNGLTPRQFLMLVSNVFTKLKWPFVFKSESTVEAEAGRFNASENVTVSASGDEADIHSKCNRWYITDMGRNKKHVDKLIAEIDVARHEFTAEQLDEQYNEIEQQSISEAKALKERLESGELTASDKLSLGVGGHYVTYALMGINVLVFLAMVVNGVHLMEPTGLDILKWGGNMRAYTASGEWWRLISCMFVHIGLIHLVLNMYALYMVGLYLEPIMGRWKFLAAYLSTGVLASLTSLWWSADRVSAGASGAIFGMYGLFVALLTTSMIDKKMRTSLLQSMAVFVIYNLIYGLKGNIDNAAHIGGLVSGFVLGYVFYFLQKKDKEAKLFPVLAIALAVIVSMNLLRNYSDDTLKFDQAWEEFAVLEQKGMELMMQRDSITADEFIKRAESEAIPTWIKIKDLLQKTDNYKLPAQTSQQRMLLKDYADKRLRYLRLWVDWEKAPDDEVLNKMKSINDSVKIVLAEMEKVKSQ